MAQIYRVPEDLAILDEVGTSFWVCSYGPERNEFFWGNKSALKLWGKATVEELVSKDICSGRSEAVKKIHQQLYATVQLSRKAMKERRTMYPNGKPVLFDLKWSPFAAKYVRGGKEESQVLALVHATEMDKAGEEEASIAHEMLRHSPTISMLFSPEGELLGKNVSAEEYYGRETLGRGVRIRDVFLSCEWEDPRECDKALEIATRLRPGDASFGFECKKSETQAGGSAVWHVVRCIPTYNPSTGAPAILVNETNVSELQHMRQAHLQQQVVMQQKEHFFASVSHELRTPLNGIIGLSEALYSDESLPAAAAETLRIIHSSGRRLSNLVNDILDAAAMKNHHLNLRVADVCLKEVSETVVNITAPLCKPSVVLKDSVPASLPAIRGDFDRLVQVVTNLVGNAIKFTAEGVVEVAAFSTAEEVVLEVRDTGIGIPRHKQDEVFLPFEQVDMTSTRQYEGTGLGLTIVKALVEAHGGSVALQSSTDEADHGSTFAIVLPRRHSSALGPDDDAVATGGATAGEVAAASEGSELHRCCSRGSGPPAHPHDAARDALPRLRSRAPPPRATLPPGAAPPPPPPPPSSSSSSPVEVQLRPPPSALIPAVLCGNRAQGSLCVVGAAVQVLVVGCEEGAWARHIATLRAKGCAVSCAFGAPAPAEVVARVREQGPGLDVLVVDGEDDGYSWQGVCSAVREGWSYSELPVALVVGEVSDEAAEEAMDAACNDCLHAGISPRQLAVRVQMLALAKKAFTAACRADTPREPEAPAMPCARAPLRRRPSLDLPPPISTREEASGKAEEARPQAPEEEEEEAAAAPSSRSIPRRASGSGEGMPFHSEVKGGRELLSIDDTQVNHMVLERIFTKEGFHFTSALDGRTALRTIEERGYLPDVVLLDVMMPDLDGFEVCSRLRELYGKELPILLISAKSEEGTVVEGFRVGADDYVLKPFKRNELVSRVLARCAAGAQDQSSRVPGSLSENAAGDAPAVLSPCSSIASSEAARQRIPSEEMEVASRSSSAAASQDGENRLQLDFTKLCIERTPSDLGRQGSLPSGEWPKTVSPSECTLASDAGKGKGCPRAVPFHSEVKGGRELLSIDDTQVNHMVLERIFTKEGFHFTSALDGRTALRTIEERGYLPDVVLLDVMMPDLDGFEVCSRLRELYGKELPILLISAKSEVVEGFRVGADDYVLKPFKRNELVSRVLARCAALPTAQPTAEVAGKARGRQLLVEPGSQVS